MVKKNLYNFSRYEMWSVLKILEQSRFERMTELVRRLKAYIKNQAQHAETVSLKSKKTTKLIFNRSTEDNTQYIPKRYTTNLKS